MNTPSFAIQDNLWYFYEIGPIDYFWHVLVSPEIAETMLARDPIDIDESEGDLEEGHQGEPPELPVDQAEDAPGTEPYVPLSERFRRDLAAIKDYAKHHGWEGDFACGPGVFWLPDSEARTFRYAFAWKQRNNGTTYVVSPLPLPFLGETKACR